MRMLTGTRRPTPSRPRQAPHRPGAAYRDGAGKDGRQAEQRGASAQDDHDRVARGTVKRIDFYKLSREKQERFIASTKGDAPPAPIVQNTETGGVTVRWAVLSAVGILALLVLYVVQFGVLGAHFALHPVEFLLLYAVLLFSIPYAALRAVANWRGPKVLPYKPGIYVFPMCLVDARRKTLGIFAMTDIGSVGKASAGGALKLSFRGGGAFAFPAQDAHDAEMLNRGIDNAQEQVKHALATSDDSELTTLDPFYEGRKSWTSPIGPKDALRDHARSREQAGLGRSAPRARWSSARSRWMAHNRSSDNAMFAKAAAQGSPEGEPGSIFSPRTAQAQPGGREHALAARRARARQEGAAPSEPIQVTSSATTRTAPSTPRHKPRSERRCCGSSRRPTPARRLRRWRRSKRNTRTTTSGWSSQQPGTISTRRPSRDSRPWLRATTRISSPSSRASRSGSRTTGRT